MVLLSAFLSDFGAKIQGLWAWPPSPAEPLGGLVMVLWQLQLLASKKELTALHRTWTAQSTKQQGIYTARRQRFSNRTAGGHLQKVWSLGVTRTLKVRTVSGIRLEAGDPENPKTSKHQIWLARCLFLMATIWAAQFLWTNLHRGRCSPESAVEQLLPSSIICLAALVNTKLEKQHVKTKPSVSSMKT